MSEQYMPELGQAIFGQPTEQFEMPDYAISMFDGIRYRFQTTYWNVNQEQFGGGNDGQDGDLGKVHWRAYCWDEDVDSGPNFWLDGHEQAIRWYKYPGRGMSCRVEYSAQQWADWHDAIVAELHMADKPNG